MKQKRMKRIPEGNLFRRTAAGAAVLMLAVMMSVTPVFADVQQIDPERTDGSITLQLEYKDTSDVIHQMNDGEVSIYQVATVDVSDGYHFDLGGGVFSDITDASVTAIPTLTEEELNQQNPDLAQILADSAAGRTVSVSDIAGGSAGVSGLTPGLFLVIQSRKTSEGVTFAPFLMTIPDADGAYQISAKPKTAIIPPDEPPETNPPETNPPETNPPETNPPETNPPGTNPPGGSGGGNTPNGGRDRTSYRPPQDIPPGSQTGGDTPPESGVLGAVRENAGQVLGAIRDPGKVLGAVRTGDPSAIFICGEIMVLAALLLSGWIAVFRKLRKTEI